MLPVATVRSSLAHLGYAEDLIQTDWAANDGIQDEPPIPLAMMAFWDHPFDRFRSALAVAELNGCPAKGYAQRIVLQTVCHVILCDDQNAELWLLDRDDVKRGQQVSLTNIADLFNRNAAQLQRGSVAKQKLRIRQYALYEADPQGQSFGDWAVRPTIDHTNRVFARLIKRVSQLVPRPLPVDDHMRWLFRLLTLRVGKDRGWGVASDLNREVISEFFERAEMYPRIWSSDRVSTATRTQIVEQVLETLQPFIFASIDPILIIKAFQIPALGRLQKRINLFPTPRPYAWDMMSSIPLHSDMSVCDPTVGTGTFLIAAGHSLWSNWESDYSPVSRLREMLHGADSSAFSVDVTQIALDLAFGWDDIGWKIVEAPAAETISTLSHGREWVIVGNPPWEAEGRSENEAGKILSTYVDTLSERKAGWIATIVPRTVWTNRSSHGRALRESVASTYQVEAVWELPWEAIAGGRSQAIASVIARGNSPAVTVWKRVDDKGIVHRVGYTSARERPSMLSLVAPDARFLRRRLGRCTKLADWYNVRVGMRLRKGKSAEIAVFQNGDVPYIEAKGDMERELIKPRAILTRRQVRDDRWIREHFEWPALGYRSELESLPQLSIPQNIYEGLVQLSVTVLKDTLLLSNRFLICTPRLDTTVEFASGVAAILTSAIGRLWLHAFGVAGRHLAKTALERFPLPPSDVVSVIGRVQELRPRRIPGIGGTYGAAVSNMSFEYQLFVCSSYGLDTKECAVVLGLGRILGFNDPLPKSLLEHFAPNDRKLEQTIRCIEELDLEKETDEGVELYIRALTEWDQRRHLVLDGEGYQIAVDKIAVSD